MPVLVGADRDTRERVADREQLGGVESPRLRGRQHCVALAGDRGAASLHLVLARCPGPASLPRSAEPDRPCPHRRAARRRSACRASSGRSRAPWPQGRGRSIFLVRDRGLLRRCGVCGGRARAGAQSGGDSGGGDEYGEADSSQCVLWSPEIPFRRARSQPEGLRRSTPHSPKCAVAHNNQRTIAAESTPQTGEPALCGIYGNMRTQGRPTTRPP